MIGSRKTCMLIKLLHLDLYGKIIIGSRIINAIVLWSMCALPFAKLDAIVLLCTMVGSLIFQGKQLLTLCMIKKTHVYYV